MKWILLCKIIKTGSMYHGFYTYRGRKFPHGNFRTSVFCEVKTQIVGKTLVFRQAQTPPETARPLSYDGIVRRCFFRATPHNESCGATRCQNTSCRKNVSFSTGLLSPDFFSDLADECELCPLLLLGQLVADFTGREAALRAEAQTVERNVLRRLCRTAG